MKVFAWDLVVGKSRTLDGNHHGPDSATLTDCWRIFELGNDRKPRTLWGWRLYHYHADGSNRCWDFYVRRL